MAAIRPNKIFGPLLRAKRLKRGLGLIELADRSELDPTQLSRMETGQRKPPELPGLVVLANALGIPTESEEFSELLAAADQERNPDLHKMALGMRGGKAWNPFQKLYSNEVTCNSLSELVSKATQRALEAQASEIAVRSQAGRVTVFKLQEGGAKLVKKRRKPVT